MTKAELKEIIRECLREELAKVNLTEGGAMSGGYAQGGALDTYKRPGGSTSRLTFDTLKGKKTRKILAKDIKPGMVTETGMVRSFKDLGYYFGRRTVEIGYGGIGPQGSYACDRVSPDREYEILDEPLTEDTVFEGLY